MSEAAAEQQRRQMRSICVIPSASFAKEKNLEKSSKKYWTNDQKCDIINNALTIIEGFPSGQRGRTVNPLAELSVVRIHLPRPINLITCRTHNVCGSGSGVEHRLAKARVASSNLVFRSNLCGCSSMVEPQPSKLMTWVRFPLPAPLKSTYGLKSS